MLAEYLKFKYPDLYKEINSQFSISIIALIINYQNVIRLYKKIRSIKIAMQII